MSRGDDIKRGGTLPCKFEAERAARIARKRLKLMLSELDGFRAEMDKRRAAADAEETESLLDAAERIHGGDK